MCPITQTRACLRETSGYDIAMIKGRLGNTMFCFNTHLARWWTSCRCYGVGEVIGAVCLRAGAIRGR